MKARGAGHRDKQWSLADGSMWCGRRPGGRRSVPGKEVGRSCGREVLHRQQIIMGVGIREEEIKPSQKWLRKVGQGDRISCNH